MEEEEVKERERPPSCGEMHVAMMKALSSHFRSREYLQQPIKNDLSMENNEEEEKQPFVVRRGGGERLFYSPGYKQQLPQTSSLFSVDLKSR